MTPFRTSLGLLALAGAFAAAPAPAEQAAAPAPAQQAAGTAPQPIPLFSLFPGGLGASESLRSEDGRLAIDLPALRTTGGANAEDGKIILLGPRRELAAAAEPAAAPGQEEEPRAVAALWPLDASRATGGRVRLVGERDSLEFGLFVPPGTPPTALTIAAVSSAYILPGRSTLRVFVGDALIGEVALRSITAAETVRLPLRPGQLAPGFNRLRIEAALAHRLYCGAEAAYDLWTSIELPASGVAFDPGAVPPGPLGFLAAAGAARGAGDPLALRGADPASPEGLAVTRALAAALGGGVAYSAEEAAPRPGRLPAPAVVIRTAASPGVNFRTGEDGRQVMEVRAADGQLPALFPDLGVAAAGAIPALPQDRPVPIETLGFPTVQIADHLWSKNVGFRLPADWLINVRKRAVLQLGYAYLPGMPTGSELRVRVNGAVVRIIPLDRGGRLNELPLEVRFDAGLLRAGRNLLAFEVSVPGDPADQPCPAAAVGRVEIAGSSTLTVPSSPSMHLPGIGRWISREGDLEVAAPAASEPEHWDVVPRLAAALRDAGGEASAAGGPKRLVVLRPTDLSSAAFGEFSVGRQVMLSALQAAPVAPRPEAPAASGVPLSFVVEPTGLVDRVAAATELAAARVSTSLARLFVPDPVADLGDWLADRRGQAILFQLDRDRPDDLFLLLSEAADLEAVLAALEASTRRGTPLDGHVALLDWAGAWHAWTDATRLPVLEERLTERNWRGVIGNFASARPIAFVAGLVALALVSVLIANSYVAASRRQR